MKKFFFILLFILLHLFAMDGFTQIQKADSLLLLQKNLKPDTNKLNALNAFAEALKNSNPDTAVYFANEAIAFASMLNYKMGIADAKLSIAKATANLGNTDEGMKNCNDALFIYNQLTGLTNYNDRTKLLEQKAEAYNTKGIIFLMQANYPEALKNLFSAILIRDKTGDKKGIANAENNIGAIYYYQRNFRECLKHYHLSLKMRSELGGKKGAAGCYNNIGLVYMEQGHYSEALKNYTSALKLAEEIDDNEIMADIYSNTGFAKTKQGKYDDAVHYLFLAIKISKEMGDKDGIAAAYINIGQAFIKQKNFSDASKYLSKALSLAEEMNGLLRMQEVYNELAVLDSSQGNFEQALEHYKMATFYRDSMFNNQKSKKILQSQFQFDFDKKESLIKAEQDRKDIVTEAEISKQKMTQKFSFAGIGIILLFSGYGFYRYHQNKKINKQLALSLIELGQAQEQLIKTEKEKEAEKIRVQISRDIHDEVGATLSGIALFSEIAIQKTKHHQDKDVQDYLENITTNSREMIAKISDIVWAINPQNDSFSRIIVKIQSFAINLCAGKGIKLHLDIDESIGTYYPGMQVRKNFYLIIKEAINNAVKYSGAKNIYVSIKRGFDVINATVKDDGNGFDTELATEGNGLNNIKARTSELNGKLNIESQKGKGASINLQMKFHPNGG